MCFYKQKTVFCTVYSISQLSVSECIKQGEGITVIFGRTSAVFLYVKYIFMTKELNLAKYHACSVIHWRPGSETPQKNAQVSFPILSEEWLKYTVVFLNFSSKLNNFFTPLRVSNWRMWHFLGYAAWKLIWKCSTLAYQCNPTSLLLWNNKYLNSENTDKLWLSHLWMKQNCLLILRERIYVMIPNNLKSLH